MNLTRRAFVRSADAVSTTLYGPMTSFTRDPARIRRARWAVADAIEAK